MTAPKRASSYAEYLAIPELTRLQRPLSKAHDEMQFIIVHQVYELWFKLMLYELTAARDAMRRGDTVHAVHTLGRVAEIVKVLTLSWPVIETMHPYDFLEFRSRLNPASGFQSLQFREVEFVSGLRDPRYLGLYKGEALSRLKRRISEPSLWDAYLRVLRRKGLRVGNDAQIVKSVIKIYENPDRHPLGTLTSALFDYDQRFSEWRQRHIRMTMRMIGARPGTGEKSVARLVASGYERMGSGGVDYLKTTLDKVFFPLLWEARTLIQR